MSQQPGDRAIAYELPAAVDDPEWCHVVVHQQEALDSTTTVAGSGAKGQQQNLFQTLRDSDPTVVSFRCADATVEDLRKVRVFSHRVDVVVSQCSC